MCDQSEVMPGGDSGPDGEEPAFPSATAEGECEERESSGCRNGQAQSEHLRGEENEASGGEVGQEDEDMTSASNDLSSSANHSPGSATGSTLASTKRYWCMALGIYLFTYLFKVDIIIRPVTQVVLKIHHSTLFQ